jgi:DNA-binding LytR/AlgR family response regulator
MQVLIVDDEPIARDILETYVLKMNDMQLVSKCRNALEAFGVLSRQHVDLVLLDINMPEISGIDFIKNLKNPPLVIFTTAYSEYAVESYELNAVDYLVKPVSFDRFLKAIDKANAILQSASLKNNSLMATTSFSGNQVLFVKSEGKLVKVDLSHLWLVEGLKDYVRLWTDTAKVIVHTTMKNFEDQLSGNPSFIRVNKSYIINIGYVTEVDGNTIRLKDQAITIGNTYRDEVHSHFDKLKLL